MTGGEPARGNEGQGPEATMGGKHGEMKRAAAERQAPSVTVYGTPSCPYCTMAREYFTNSGIRFGYHDVSGDREKAMEMYRKSGQLGVPVIEINGRVLVGFDRKAVEAALRSGKPPAREDVVKNLLFDPFQ